MSCQRILAQINNAVPSATVTASSVLPASRQIFQRQTTRDGNGSVVLSGDYKGAADATFDVEIRTPSTGAELATTPVFAGAGNGTLEDLSIAPGTAAQDITVTLVDLGTATSAAQLTIYGDILLRAKTAGSGGNALVLTVTPNLTLSASAVGALSTAFEKDTQDWTDQRGDFGAAPLLPDGTIPATAPRIVFGGDLSRVYRHYKRWDGDQWRYGVSPKLAAAYPEGSTVHTVTGDYSVTVTDGVTPETYASVTTLYSLLTALAASAIVEVVGAVGNNAKPAGIAGIDLPIRTSAFALPIIASDPDRMPGLTDVTVAASSPTETIAVECTKNSPVGSETWAVRSKAAGTALADAVTGALYTDSAAIQFRIPVIPRTESPVSGVMAITARSFPRDTGDTTGVPAICLDRPQLGASASGKTLRLIWTERPVADCDCSEATVSGGPSSKCLGIDIEGAVDMGALVAGYQTRLEALYSRHADFVSANTEITAAGELRSAQLDIQLDDLATAKLAECLADIFGDSDSPAAGALTAWDAALTALDSDLTPLEALDDADLSAVTVADATVKLSAVSDDYGAAGVPTEGTTEVVSLSDEGVLHRYLCVHVETWSGKTAARYALPDHADGSVKKYRTADISGTSGSQTGWAFWQDLGIVTSGATDINSDAGIAAQPGTAWDVETFATRYQAKMDYVRALAGLVPKSNASGGDSCWRDPGDAYYWVIEGTAYLPVFSNVYYHSVVMAPNADGKMVPTSTHEFGFGLQVACAERLQVGDSITINIGDVTADYPYVIGDTYKIPIIGGGPLSFAGGIDGTDTLTWAVRGSVDGALDDYALNLDEDPYDNGGLNFAIHRGGIDFALDDRFTFSVEAGGRFRWRKDAGAWSADTAIADTVILTDGLSALFQSGAAPSFVEGDVYSYSARQPNAPDHTQSAHGETWRWSGTGATLTLTWASDQTVSVVGLLRHGLSSSASVSIVLKNSGGTTLATLTPTVTAGPLISVLGTPLTTVRTIGIAITNATAMALGWVYAGVPFEPSANARMTWRRAYAMDRAGGLNPRGTYLGAGRSGEMTWNDFLTQESADTLLALIDDCKADDDAPIAVVPQILFPQDSVLARINSDALDFSDWYEFQPDDRARRALSLTLPLAAVLS